MPKYVYLCKECDCLFEIKHSLHKKHTICEFCNADGHLIRQPSAIFISKKQSYLPDKSKTGTLVKAIIEETREDLRAEQDKLINREYKNDK